MAKSMHWTDESSLKLGRAAALVTLCMAHVDHATGRDDARDWRAVAGLLAHVDLLAGAVAGGANVAPVEVQRAVRQARAVAAIVAREATTASDALCEQRFDDDITTLALDALEEALRFAKAEIDEWANLEGSDQSSPQIAKEKPRA